MKIQPQYPPSQNVLYRFRNKRRLAILFSLTLEELTALRNNPTYHSFTKSFRGKKPRLIEKPIGKLDGVHKRIQTLLSRIQTPSYLFSGKKNTTYIDNASVHLKSNYFLSLDIEKYYPSTKTEHVFRFFHHIMLMSEDVAWFLADLVTYNGHIPTGSYLSQTVAYWSYAPLFNKLFQLAESNDIVFSLYVDDITFSSDKPIPKSFELEVMNLIYSSELTIKKSKLKKRSKKHFKVVTGVAITPNKTTLIPNKLREKIHDTLGKYSDITKVSVEDLDSLIGQINAARKIEPNYHEMILDKLKKLNRLIIRERKPRKLRIRQKLHRE